MPEPLLSRASLFFMLFRAAYVAVGLLGLALVWRRPRPSAAAALVVLLNLGAWAAYVAPLARLYALGERGDRGFNVGMAACTAVDGSPWDHVQVRHAAVEPFWNALVAALALRRPERVVSVYHWLPPVVLLAVALGLYLGLRRPAGGEADGWERVMMLFALLGLSSYSLGQNPPVPALWAANFLLKPNHAAAWALLFVALGMYARGARAWRLGLVLGLMAWVFLLDWAYAGLVLVVAAALQPRGARRPAALAAALGLGLALALPDLANLSRDYSPLAAGGSAGGVWRELHTGVALALPQWVTLDVAPLLALAVAGAWVWRRRGGARDRTLLGLLLGAWVLWAGYVLAAFAGWAPGADELHYFLRLALALAAGTALAEGARRLEGWRALASGRGALIVMGLALPVTFPAWWDPPTMDRYWRFDRQRVSPDFEAYARFVRDETPPGAVFVAGPSSATWIPALAGRRVLLASDARPPADYARRKQAERILLTSDDDALVRHTARAWGVTHVAVDPRLRLEYGPALRAGSAPSSAYASVYASPAMQILALQPAERGDIVRP